MKGDWKIASISDGPWKLYNIAKDPAESTDLAEAMPEKLGYMNDQWFAFANDKTKWKQPIKDYQEGWGFHRIRMVMPAYESARPHLAAADVPLDTPLAFTFSQPISFRKSKGK